MITILVDADACPTISIIEKVSTQFDIPVIYITDTAHYITSSHQVIVVDQGKDSADYKLLELTTKESIVITQDYALAGLCLTKHAIVLHTNAFIIDNSNIDQLLDSRYLNQKARQAKQKTSNPKKRKEETNLKFEQLLIDIIKSKLD